MKAVFFSTDRTEVDNLSKKLIDQSIPCEIREGLNGGTTGEELELWVQRDEDLPRAFMECVRSGIGFAKRKTPAADRPRQLFSIQYAELFA